MYVYAELELRYSSSRRLRYPMFRRVLITGAGDYVQVDLFPARLFFHEKSDEFSQEGHVIRSTEFYEKNQRQILRPLHMHHCQLFSTLQAHGK